jgi:Ras family
MYDNNMNYVNDVCCTLNKQVGSQTGADVAAELGLTFIEASAVTGDSVDEAFLLVCKAVLEKRHRAQQQGYSSNTNSSANSGDIGAQLDATTKLINRVSSLQQYCKSYRY